MATPEERTELLKLAARVDAMSVQPETNRFHYLNLHEQLHHRIAECTRCPALCDAIERTRALSSTWLCVARTFCNGHAPRRHQELLAVLVSGDREAAAEAMREHVTSSMQRAIERLEPIFKARKTQGKTYSRNPKNQFSVAAAADGAVNTILPTDATPAL
jgi:DNA-binding GntR family transcriptional regulator